MKPALPNTESGGHGDFDVYKACESTSKSLSISPARSLAGESWWRSGFSVGSMCLPTPSGQVLGI